MKMMRAVVALALVALALAPSAARAATWTEVGDALASEKVSVLVAVRHGVPLAELEQQCVSVSTPTSATYGKYLSLDATRELVAADENLQTVLTWLQANGVTDSMVRVPATRDFVSITAPVATIEALFSVDMRVFDVVSHTRGRREAARHIRSAESAFALPEHVADAIDVVLGVSDRFLPERFSPVLSSPTALRGATKKAAKTSAVASSSGTEPQLFAPLITGDNFYVLFFQGGPLAADTGYELNITIDGTQKERLTFAATDAVAAPGEPGLYFLKSAQYMKAYSAYNFTFGTVDHSTGQRSAPQTLALDWATLPKTYKGVIATPAISPSAYFAAFGIEEHFFNAGATQAVAEFSGQFLNWSDLELYLQTFDLSTVKNATLVGPNTPSSPGIESQMDIELIEGISPNATSTFWSVASPGFILEWAMQMSDATSPPMITSISYGGFEDQMSATQASRTNAEFLKLCARGLTVVIASGDAGASGKGHGTTTCAIQPVFPASSPWVTSVSATQQSPLAEKRLDGGIGQIPVSVDGGNFWTTGGGFSTLPSCPRPAYQASVVEHYLNTAALPPVAFNNTGRGYPDVSSIGTNYFMSLYGVTLPLGAGTSSAAPTFAGVLARLTQARLKNGLPPLGFANPLLYDIAARVPSSFYDVTLGNNRCGQGSCCEHGGFDSSEGWDPVTGLGTVGDYTILEMEVLSAGYVSPKQQKN